MAVRLTERAARYSHPSDWLAPDGWYWGLCHWCFRAFVRCPVCGRGCCGDYGDRQGTPCDCADARAYLDECYRLGTVPSLGRFCDCDLSSPTFLYAGRAVTVRARVQNH